MNMQAPRPSLLSFSVLVSLSLLGLAMPAQAQTTRVRMMAANTTSGNLQSYDPGEGTRIFQGLKPDIVMLQEFNYGDNSATTLRNWVNNTFGTTYSYYQQPGGVQIPNGIISRYPILSAGVWDDTQVSNRDFVWARIDVPGTKDLWAISVHLLTTSASVRNTEATNLKNFITANIPAGDYVVLGGDFNTSSRTEACISTFGSYFVTSGSPPADQSGNSNTNASRAKPYDWVLADTDLNALKTSVVIGTNTHTNGLVFDSRVYSPLSLVSPVLSGDSGATNMQHMAVVRDFLIPGGSTTATPTPAPTASPTASPTPSPSPTATATATASATATPSPTPTASATPSPTPSNVLTSGVPVSTTVAQGAWAQYTINVPSGASQMVVSMTGSSGDADLYIRKAGVPTSSLYDYRPYLSGSAESVTITQTSTPTALGSGTWYIGAYGYTGPAPITLTATITSATASPTPTATPTPTPTSTGNDAYEADDTMATAKTITVNGTTQTHNINPAADVDYIKFVTTGTSNIKVETNGPTGGDTYLIVYNSAGTSVGSDDDSGTGTYSLASLASLPAGTYYAKVASYNFATVITGYTIRVYTY